MQKSATQLWSVLVVILSQYIIEIKREALDRIKLRSVNQLCKKLKRTDFQSKKSTQNNPRPYMSISDFKPLSNLYSSVKIHEQDFGANQFQTKKQIIKGILKEKQKQCRLQDWMVGVKAKMILPQQYPHSQFSKRPILNYSQQAINSIKMFKFDDFCESNLKKKKTLFTLKQINTLEYRQDCISDSLLNLPDTKVQVAIDIFSHLLNAGNQNNNTPFPSIWYIWKFVHSVIEQKEDIRQQAYLQIIKQMNSKKKIYCQIFACLCSIVQPSTGMYLPLLNYIYYHSLDPELEQFIQYYNFCFFSLIKNFQKPRKAVPSIFEIFCIMNLRKIPLLINFPRQNIFFMQNFSTVQQIVQQLIELYGLEREEQYILNIQGILLQKGNILDGINKSRQNEDQSLYWERFSFFQGFRAFIVIKNILNMNKSLQNFLIMSNYIINQYRKGLFLVNNKAIYQIGGLIIASEMQNQDFYQFSLAKYLPRKKYDNGLAEQKRKKIQKNILKQYSMFKGTRLEARKKIVSMLSKSKAFLTHFFLCNVFIDQQQYTQAWVGLKPDHMLIIQPSSNRILLTIEFQHIRKWGQSSSQLCLVVDDLGNFHIENTNLDTFVSIFRSYLDYIYKQVIKEKQEKQNILRQVSKQNQNQKQDQKEQVFQQ